MEQTVLNFIHYRFPVDCHWLDGNCYYFALILCNRFSQLSIYYNPVDGHFFAGNGHEFYDWTGRIYPPYAISFDEIKNEEPQWYGRLVRDCIM